MSTPDDAPGRDADSGTASRPLLEERIAVLAMAVLVLLTLVNVIVRYTTDESFAMTEEVSIALMVLLTLAGAASAAARDRHLRIEYFYESGSPARRRRLALFSALACAAFFGFFTVLLGRYVWDEYRFGETTMALGVPRWWYSIWLPVFSLALTVRCLQLARRRRAE